MKAVHVKTRDFSGGLVTQLPPWLLSLHQSPMFQNCDPSAVAGKAVKRGGRTRVGVVSPTATGDGSVSGLHVFRKDASVSGTSVFNIATEGTKVYSYTPTGWTDITQAGATTSPANNVDCWMATLGNLVVITMGWAIGTSKAIQAWDGITGTTTSLSVAPLGTGISNPTGAKYCAKHNSSMWYANTLANTSGLWKTAVNTIDGWNTAFDTFFQNVYPGGGDVIRGIAEVGDTLFVAKQNNLYVVYGSNFDQYTILPHSLAHRGLISDRGWVVYRSLFVYAASDGIYAAGPNTFTELSIPIKDRYLAIADLTTISAGSYRDQVWFAFRDTGSATNNAAFVLDMRRGTWSKYTNIPSRVFFRDIDGALYSGFATAGTTTQVMQHDQGTQDEGTNITQIIETPDLDFNAFTSDKVISDIFLWFKPLAAGTLTVDIFLDGVGGGGPTPTGKTSVYPLALAMDAPAYAPSASSMLVKTLAHNWSRGKLCRIRLTNADSAQTEFYGVAVNADIMEPVQSDLG